MRHVSLAIALSALAISFAGCAAEAVYDESELDEALRVDCSLVRCALPLCGPGQRLHQPPGTCCPTCVGAPDRTDRCATVLCAAVACPEGEQLVYSPGQCCGTCRPVPPVAECSNDWDCPQIYCFACPCPVSECRGNQCVTSTPDESTCGNTF